MLHETVAREMGGKPWYELDEAGLIAFAKKDRHNNDSIAHAAFDPFLTKQKPGLGELSPLTTSNDKYLTYFKNMVLLDNQFIELYYLLTMANQKQYDYAAAKALIENHTDPKLLKSISRDEYLASDDYKTWVVGGEYTNYLLKLDYLQDSTLRKKKGYRLQKMDEAYTGKVKEYVLFHQMTGDITFAKDFDQLNYCKDMFAPYIAKLKNKVYQTSLKDQFSTKEQELLKNSVGKPAPAFTLKSIAGTTHSLADFKGKVVFIDLWASWCGPCRAETPHLAALYEKYKKDERIAFVSVAVSDGQKEWRQAVQKDQPAWLQLVDKDDQVRKAYVANMIPQFIIVDKQGKIANFNAPEPSTGQTLETLLLKEMNK
jgi:thiol-disulfide isomerase/thioredoxin